MLWAVQMESGMEVKQRMVAEKLTVSELVTTQLLALPPVVQVLRPILLTYVPLQLLGSGL